MSRILLSLILFLACACSQAAQTILIVGDSLSAGFGIAQDQSWPMLLAGRLAAESYPYAVINISISGETTSGGLSRLDPALRQYRPAIVVIALGANDGLRGLPLEQMRGNLRAMIRQSQAHHAQVLLVGMRLPPNYGVDYTQEFQQVFTDLSRQHKAALVPFLFAGFAAQRDAFQNDGLHPTAATQPRLLDNVWAGLQPLLRKP
jgi:acyl-CoA thioesterase-1